MRIFTAIKITTTKKLGIFLWNLYLNKRVYCLNRRGDVQREKKKHKLWKIALLKKQWIKKLKYLINPKAIKKKKSIENKQKPKNLLLVIKVPEKYNML